MIYQIELTTRHWEDNEDCAPYWSTNGIVLQANSWTSLLNKVAAEKYNFLLRRLSYASLPEENKQPTVTLGSVCEIKAVGTISDEDLETSPIAQAYRDKVERLRQAKAQNKAEREARERAELARLKEKYKDI